MTRDGAAHYLAAMIDGEGTVSTYRLSTRPGERGRGKRSARISNTELDIIEATEHALTVLGIAFRRTHHTIASGLAYEISISQRTSLTLLHEIVPIQSRRKRAVLHHAVTTYCWDERPADAEMQAMYVEQQMSLGQIAAAKGVAVTTAARWLRASGIEARSLSDATKIRHARSRA